MIESAVQTCASCHNSSSSINAPDKTPTPPHPATTEDCGVCHNTDNFADAVFDHTGIVDDCAQCHTGNVGEATGKPIGTHLVTTEDCSVCHTPGTFTTGIFNHGPSYIDPPALCTDCHNDTITAGKPFSHIPTTEDCSVCHNTTDFADAIFVHVGINTNNCVQCHDGDIATGKPSSTHLPTTQNCFACHNYPNTDMTFKDASNFSHSGISGNCESCHSGNPNYVTVGAIGKKTNHIPALNECVVCHDAGTTNPGNFSPSAHFWGDVHLAIITGCEGCHIARLLPSPSASGVKLVKDAKHVPTTQDCGVCHSNARLGFTESTMLAHVGITGNCVSCHNGNFTGIGTIGARAKTPSPPAGKHPVTSADCVSCHDTTDFANASVDHNSPAVLAARCDSCHDGFQPPARGKIDKPNHVSTTEDCGVCHIAGGNFKPAVFNHTGIVDNCASCHVADGTGSAIGMDDDHITTPEDCSLCHNTVDFAGATFEHQGIVDNCASCHNGTTATGKPNFHVPTSGDCVDCHQTTGFTPATFSHAGIVDNCSSCHDAGFATPKKTAHVPTNQDCGVCHNTSVFKPATFDHTGITNNCVSCHDGDTATGKMDAVPDHFPTNLDCVSCHTTATFAGGSWVHDASTANNCKNCHDNGGGATEKPNGHLNTTDQCDVCHTTNRWAPTNFSHDPNGAFVKNKLGDHRRDPGCNGCHGPTIGSSPDGMQWRPSRKPQYAPFCAACHANDFESESDHRGGKNGTVEQNKGCGDSGCHRVSDSDFD